MSRMNGFNSASQFLIITIILVLCTPSNTLHGEDQQLSFQVTGLFSEERIEDLQSTFETIPDISINNVDYNLSSIVITCDVEKILRNAKPEQILNHLNNLVRRSSNSTFGLKPLLKNREHLKLVKIPVEGLDCKGCSFGAYRAIYQLEGVEQATASFKVGLVTALVDPKKINKADLEEALRKRGVFVLNRE